MGFGSGAFQAARIAIDGVTIIENITTGKIQAPGVIIPSTTTSSYLTIPIANNQNVATPAPFQQLIQLNLSQYPQLQGIASDLSNIYFSSDQKGQNKLYSWRETPASLTSDVTWWVLLPNGIPANGTITIYLQVSSSTALDGVYTGEAPQLSSTYAQYDNGASIFQFYDNFVGTTLSSKWEITQGSATYNVDNGLTIIGPNTGGCTNAGTTVISSISQFSPNVILDFYGYFNGGGSTAHCFFGGVGFNNSFGSGNLGFIGTGNANFGFWYTGGNVISIPYSPLTNIVYSVVSSTIQTGVSENYGGLYVSNTVMQPLNIQFAFQSSCNITASVQWLRTRAYPPNGVMPVLQAQIAQATQSAIISSANTWTAPQAYTEPININVGQTTLTGTTAGSIVYSMPDQGSSYKKFIAYANGYENDTTTTQTIALPALFTYEPYIVTSPSGLIQSITTSLEIPITITNNQSSATPAPFQQQIVINPSNYSSYLTSNLSNANFQDGNGNILDSWLESGNSNTSTSTIYWVNLPNGIPANSSVTIYYHIYAKNVNVLNTTNTGEAPQLSSTYGQYDNGANVFNNYWNFAGTSLPASFTSGVSSDGTLTVNNGLTLGTSTSDNPSYAYIVSTSTYAPQIVEFYLSGIPTSSGGFGGISKDWGFSSSTSPTPQGGGTKNNFEYLIGSVIYSGSGVYTYELWDNNTEEASGGGALNTGVYGTYINPLNLYYNYAVELSATTTITSSNYLLLGISSPGPSAGSPASETIQVNWLRTRAYPPNGVMPSVSFGSVQSTSSITLASGTTTTYTGWIIIEGY